jgi:hypothetical protein
MGQLNSFSVLLPLAEFKEVWRISQVYETTKVLPYFNLYLVRFSTPFIFITY